jgi:hypothetical protein
LLLLWLPPLHLQVALPQTPHAVVAADAASLKDVFSAFAGFGIHTPTPTKAAEPVFHTNTATPTTVRRVSTPGSAAGGKAAGPGMDGFRWAGAKMIGRA